MSRSCTWQSKNLENMLSFPENHNNNIEVIVVSLSVQEPSKDHWTEMSWFGNPMRNLSRITSNIIEASKNTEDDITVLRDIRDNVMEDLPNFSPSQIWHEVIL